MAYFWSVKIGHGDMLEICGPEGLILSLRQAALEGGGTATVWASMQTIEGTKTSAVICTLRGQDVDQCTLNLGCESKLLLECKADIGSSVHLSGQWLKNPFMLKGANLKALAAQSSITHTASLKSGDPKKPIDHPDLASASPPALSFLSNPARSKAIGYSASMSSANSTARGALEAKIEHNAERLAALTPGPDSARVRKRLLQSLGKLKKELAVLVEDGSDTAAHLENTRICQEEAATGADNDGLGLGGNIDGEPMSTKKNKALVHVLDKELARCAVTKQLKQARARVRQGLRRGLSLDVTTYTSLMNVHVRCGDVAGAAALLAELESGTRGVACVPTVVTYTTMLRGFCEAGDMTSARKLLLETMTVPKARPGFQPLSKFPKVQPNVRAINTFLRGCVRAGDVASLADVCPLLAIPTKSSTNGKSDLVPPDMTTIEHIVRLLGQQGFVTGPGGALEMIAIFTDILSSASRKQANSSKGGDGGGSALVHLPVGAPCPLEYSSMCISVLRCFILSKGVASPAAREWLCRSREQLERNKAETLLSSMMSHAGRGPGLSAAAASSSTCGSRKADEEAGARKASKSTEQFLRHARAEMLQELSWLETQAQAQTQVQAEGRLALLLQQLRQTVLFGVEPQSEEAPKRGTAVSSQHWAVQALERHLGLTSVLYQAQASQSSSSVIDASSPAADSAIAQLESHFSSCLAPGSAIGDGTGVEGCFKPSRLFTSNQQTLPLHLELGSGAGEWAVAQSESSRGKVSWLALERRFDRCYQTLVRAVASLGAASTGPGQGPIAHPALGILWGNAAAILKRFPDSSISHVFSNLPEPPARLSGEGQSDGQHMLTSEFLGLIARVLCPGGRVTIVTDNLPYGESLCAAVVRANVLESKKSRKGETARLLLSAKYSTLSESGSGTSHSVQHRAAQQLPLSEERAAGLALAAAATTPRRSSCSEVLLVRGEAGAEEGHVASGASSYFDRMWDSGHKTRRWFLMLQRVDC